MFYLHSDIELQINIVLKSIVFNIFISLDSLKCLSTKHNLQSRVQTCVVLIVTVNVNITRLKNRPYWFE